MERSFQAAMSLFDPEVVFVLGETINSSHIANSIIYLDVVKEISCHCHASVDVTGQVLKFSLS